MRGPEFPSVTECGGVCLSVFTPATRWFPTRDGALCLSIKQIAIITNIFFLVISATSALPLSPAQLPWPQGCSWAEDGNWEQL